jgi:hypothetical protein
MDLSLSPAKTVFFPDRRRFLHPFWMWMISRGMITIDKPLHPNQENTREFSTSGGQPES